jgi:signal transduction histidine kinase
MELLYSEINEDLRQEFLLPALYSEKYLLNIINDILDFAQIEA